MNKKTSIKILITIVAVLIFAFLIPSLTNNVNAVSMGGTDTCPQGLYAQGTGWGARTRNNTLG